MGFFNDFIRGATPAIAGGTDIGLRGMAEAQRRKEEAEIQRRNAEQQAFMNLMRQQEMERLNQRDIIGDKQWEETNRLNRYNSERAGVNELSQAINTFTNNQADNVRADRVAEAQIGNYKEGRAPSEAEFYWNQMTPEQQQEAVRNYAQNKFKPAASGGGSASLTPSNILSLRGQMMNPLQGGDPNTPMGDIINTAGQIQRTTDSLNVANAGGQPQPMPQGQSQGGSDILDQILDSMTPEQIQQLLNGN